MTESIDLSLQEFYELNVKTFEQFCDFTSGDSVNGILYLVHQSGQIQCIFVSSLADLAEYFTYKVDRIELQGDTHLIYIQEP